VEVNDHTNIINTNKHVDLHCLEVFVRVDDIGVIVDLHCLEVFVRFVDIGVIVDHHCLNFALQIHALALDGHKICRGQFMLAK
jgi:hypothetical protein